jgi:hypothetical protein
MAFASRKDSMAQAVASSTDELLSQLAASEIDRLLAEADGNAAPGDEKSSKQSATAVADPLPGGKIPAADCEAVANGTERAALLQAAGFESAEATAVKEILSPKEVVPREAPPVEDERSAVLHAAGFESPGEIGLESKELIGDASDEKYSDHLPFYLKPLIWINVPLDSAPEIVRQMMGKVGVVTLINAIAVLTYVFFFRKH